MKKKHFVKFLAGFLSSLIIFTSCTGSGSKDSGASNQEDSSGKTTITMVTAGGGFWEDSMAELEKAYEDAHPDVDLKIEIYGYEQLFQVIEVKVAGGSSEYDIIAVDDPLVAAYTQRGYIQPLDDYFSAEEQSKFVASSLETSKWDGRFMAAPFETSAEILFYNKTLLEQAGITYEGTGPHNQATWEDLIEMSNKVLDNVDPNRDQGYFGISFEQASRPYEILTFANTFGEKGLSDDGFTVDGVINTDGWVKAATFYHDLFESKVSLRGIKAEEFGPMFFSGKAVFHLGGPWNSFTADASEEYDYGMAVAPTFAGYESTTATSTGSWHLGLATKSENAEIAAEAIKFMTLGEGNRVWIGASKDIPATTELLDELYNSPDSNEVYKICIYQTLNTAYPRPITPGYSEWETVMTNTFEDIRNGADPKQSLDGAVEQITQLFKKYQ